jgi:hypothetical protein
VPVHHRNILNYLEKAIKSVIDISDR